MRLVDVHCHLESGHFTNTLDLILKDAKDAGVYKLITNSITPGQWPRSRQIAEQYNQVEFALGVHPWYARQEDLKLLDTLPEACQQGAIAIGEIGLDRKIASPDFALQMKIFEKQLAIARELNFPVIMHCRGAFNELIAAIKRVGSPAPGGIIHSFSGSAELADSLIPLGISFSLGGILTYKKSKKRAKALRRIFPDHFLLETDSPDIPPVHLHDTINVPSNIRYNLSAAATILEEPEELIARRTTENAIRIFGMES